MIVIIKHDDGLVFASYTTEDIKKELLDNSSDVTFTDEEVHEEFKTWITIDMNTLYRNQKQNTKERSE
jgi:hypothetical protein